MATETDLKDRENLNPAHNPGDDAFKDIIDHSYPLKEQERLKKTADIDATATPQERADREQLRSNAQTPIDRIRQSIAGFRLTRRQTGGGIIGLIVALLLGGGLFLGPNFAVIHLKEILMDDFNYVRDGASDAQLKVFGKQLQERAAPCAVVKYYCRYEGLSARQVKLMRDAGVEITEKRPNRLCALSPSDKFCRTFPKKVRFQGREYTAGELARELRSGQDRELIAAFRTGFQPRWIAFASKTFDKVRLKYNASKEPIVAVSHEEITDEIEENIEAANPLSDDQEGPRKGEDGKYYGSDGKELSSEQVEAYERTEKIGKDLEDLGDPKKVAVGGAVNVVWSALSATKAVSIPCQAYGYIKMASLGLKMVAAATFVAVTWNAIYQPADSLKLGQGSTLAILLAAGTRFFTADKAGKTAFETRHYESAVEKVPRRDYTDVEARVYGGLSLGLAGSVIKKALNTIKQYTGNDADKTCNIALNPWVQGTGLIVGIAAAIFTGGTSAIGGAVAGAAAQTTISIAVAAVIPTILGIVSKNLAKGVVGGELGIMGFLGKAQLHSENAQFSGFRAQNKAGAAAQTKRMLADARERAELERLTHKPWDISSPYTLAGSTIRSLAPKLASVRNGLKLTTLPAAFFGAISGKLDAKARANDADYAIWRAQECQENYSPKLATGPDCETEYKTYTDLDMEENDKWLEENGYIDSEGNLTEKANDETGVTKDCTDRTIQIGLTDETTKDPGDKCIDGEGGDKEELFDRFDAHAKSKLVLDGMDEEPNPSLIRNEGGAAAGPVVGGTSAADVKKFQDRVKNEWGNGKVPSSALCALGDAWKGHMLYCAAKDLFLQVNTEYKAKFGKNICITDSYRTYEDQVRLKKAKPGLAATPGTSNHGYGLALDLCGGIQNSGSSEHNWLHQNGPAKGWFNPKWARPGGSKLEPWHFEFQGIGAKGD